MSFFFLRGKRKSSVTTSINSTSDDEEEISSSSSTTTMSSGGVDTNALSTHRTVRWSGDGQQQLQLPTKEDHNNSSHSSSSSSIVDGAEEQSMSGLLQSVYNKRKVSFSDESHHSDENSTTTKQDDDNIFSLTTSKGNVVVTPNISSNRRSLTKIPSSLRLDPKTFPTRKNSTNPEQIFTPPPRYPLSIPILSKQFNESSKIVGGETINAILSTRNYSQQVIVIIEIGRKYFKCGISGEYCPRVVVPIPFELSELLCKCKNYSFNVKHMKEAFTNFENEIGSSNIETDEIFDEYTTIGPNYNDQCEDDASYEEKLSILLEQQLRRIFVDELKLHLDSIDQVVILESIHSLHESLVRKIVENVCSRKRFSKLKGIKFINSQCCALIPSSCSSNNQNFQTPNNDQLSLTTTNNPPLITSIPPPILSGFNSIPRQTIVCEELEVHGLVIDCGYSECKIVPIIFGSIVQSGVKIISVGSKHVLRQLKHSLMKMNSKEALTPQNRGHVVDLNKVINDQDEEEIEKYGKFMDSETMLLEDILTRVCYCDGEGDNPLVPYSDVVHYWNGRFCISIPDTIRREACNLLYEPLVECIISSLKHIELEQRYKIMKNLLVCGGLAEIAGFKKKLLRTLRNSLYDETIDNQTKSWLKHIGVVHNSTVACISPSILNWYGASIMSTQLL